MAERSDLGAITAGRRYLRKAAQQRDRRWPKALTGYYVQLRERARLTFGIIRNARAYARGETNLRITYAGS